MAFKLDKHERMCTRIPVVIQHVCENCGEGEMTFSTDQSVTLVSGHMLKHKCDKCGFEMMLPKMYPYVTWLTEEEYAEAIKEQEERENNADESDNLCDGNESVH